MSFDIHAFIQQIVVNAGGVLLGYIIAKFPKVGPLIKEYLIDILIGNPKHD